MNVVTWEKSNPPPNFSCRYFTYSTEQIIWARKSEKVPHYFNYELMKQFNADKQMKDVWKLPAIAPWEKSNGKHPTQKPLSVLSRLILASTKPDALILDPFAGSSTTGIAANLYDRRFIGIDQEEEFLKISELRKKEIENPITAKLFKKKIAGLISNNQTSLNIENEATRPEIKIALGFCRSKDLNTLSTNKTFYFHAIESNNVVKDFPIGILNAAKLLIYTTGSNNTIHLTGHISDIKSIKLKHKSTISGKENSKTDFYYEIMLEDCFQFNEDLKFSVNTKQLFEQADDQNLIKHFLPALTSFDKILHLKEIISRQVNKS